MEDLAGLGVLGIMAGFMVFNLIILLGLYIYMGFAYMAIGKKIKLKSPELSWIPFVGPNIIAYQASKMHWWPWLLLIGMIIPFLNILASIAFMVMSIIWHWHMFERVKRPGWWAILFLIPIVGLIMVGIAAWSKE